MKIELDKSLALPLPQSAGWALLNNIEEIVSCVPGAKITERVDATHYKGTISVKLGPANISFRGDFEVVSSDDATHTLRIVGKASDTTGTSGSSLDLTAMVAATGADTCELVGHSEVSVTGKVAAFGSRLMGTVTEQLLKVFFANVLVRAQEQKALMGASTAASIEAGVLDTVKPAVAPPPAREARLNAFAFLWGMIKDLVLGKLGRTNAG